MYVFVNILLFVLAGRAVAEEKVCKLPVNPGKTCSGGNSAENKMYYFNTKLEACKPFQYLGCEGKQNDNDGKENKFSTSDDCIDSCQNPWFREKNKNDVGTDDSGVKDRQKSDCDLKLDAGPCRALIPMWYFDNLTRKCLSFAYGGCNGTSNRFGSQTDCEHFCNEIKR